MQHGLGTTSCSGPLTCEVHVVLLLISVMAEAVRRARQKDADDEQVPMFVKTDGKLLEESKQRSIDVVAGTQSLMVIVILALA